VSKTLVFGAVWQRSNFYQNVVRFVQRQNHKRHIACANLTTETEAEPENVKRLKNERF